MIQGTIILNGGARPASELAELARRALDEQLGFAIKDQLAGPDADAEEAARVFGDFYALAAQKDGTPVLDADSRTALVAEGRSESHLRKLELLVNHSAGTQPLSDAHLRLRLEAFGFTYDPIRAAVDRRTMLSAWADAQQRAALFHAASVQAHANPIRHLFEASRASLAPAALNASPATLASDMAPSTAGPPKPADDAGAAACSSQAMPLMSQIVDQVVDAIVDAGRWKDGRGSVADDAKRLFRQFCWIVGDRPVDRYSQQDLATFDREMMRMPKTVRAQSVWNRPYADVKKGFPPLTKGNRRHARTMNKDLSYLATIAIRMVSEGYWIAGAMQPLLLSHKVTKKEKEKAKAPWTVAHVEQMLSCPIYHGNAGPKRRLRSGEHLYQDAAYWLLLLAIYTAGCQEELGGILLVEVVVSAAGIPHLVIRDNRLRTLKRDARERVVPLHAPV